MANFPDEAEQKILKDAVYGFIDLGRHKPGRRETFDRCVSRGWLLTEKKGSFEVTPYGREVLVRAIGEEAVLDIEEHNYSSDL